MNSKVAKHLLLANSCAQLWAFLFYKKNLRYLTESNRSIFALVECLEFNFNWISFELRFYVIKFMMLMILSI